MKKLLFALPLMIIAQAYSMQRSYEPVPYEHLVFYNNTDENHTLRLSKEFARFSGLARQWYTKSEPSEGLRSLAFEIGYTNYKLPPYSVLEVADFVRLGGPQEMISIDGTPITNEVVNTIVGIGGRAPDEKYEIHINIYPAKRLEIKAVKIQTTMPPAEEEGFEILKERREIIRGRK